MRHGLNTHATSTCLLAEQGQHVEQGSRQVEPSLATTQEKYGKLLSQHVIHPLCAPRCRTGGRSNVLAPVTWLQ